MKAYVGKTSGAPTISRLNAAGLGEMTVRGQLLPKRYPFAFDNGAFMDWKAGRPFKTNAFIDDILRIDAEKLNPDFVVVPDVVAGGLHSLSVSMSWVDDLRGAAPLYLAVQDGMERSDVEPVIEQFDGLFVGGTLDWKLLFGASWVQLAHDHSKPCHIGRVGTAKRVRWAIATGCDSIDSCLPLWSQDNLRVFVAALNGG